MKQGNTSEKLDRLSTPAVDIYPMLQPIAMTELGNKFSLALLKV